MHLTVALTSKCNLDCSYCSAATIMANSNDKKDLLTDILDIIENHKASNTLEDVEGIGWLGGEPLLEKRRLFSYIRLIREKYPNIKHSINTNGYYLDSTTVEFCNTNNISIIMSLDGVMQGERSLQRLIQESKVGSDIIPNLRKLDSKWFRVVVVPSESFSDRVIEIYRKLDFLSPVLEVALDHNRTHALTPDEIMNVVYEFRQINNEVERIHAKTPFRPTLMLHTFSYNIECDCTVQKNLSAEGEVSTHAKYTRQDSANMGVPYGCIDTAIRFGIEQYNLLSAIVTGELRK